MLFSTPCRQVLVTVEFEDGKAISNQVVPTFPSLWLKVFVS